MGQVSVILLVVHYLWIQRRYADDAVETNEGRFQAQGEKMQSQSNPPCPDVEASYVHLKSGV